MLHFSENLHLIRVLTGLTQTEFGLKFDATKAMIVSYEKGKAMPGPLFISRICKLAKVSENDLMKKKLTEDDVKVDKLKKKEKEDGEAEILREMKQEIARIREYLGGIEEMRAMLAQALKVNSTETPLQSQDAATDANADSALMDSSRLVPENKSTDKTKKRTRDT